MPSFQVNEWNGPALDAFTARPRPGWRQRRYRRKGHSTQLEWQHSEHPKAKGGSATGGQEVVALFSHDWSVVVAYQRRSMLRWWRTRR